MGEESKDAHEWRVDSMAMRMDDVIIMMMMVMMMMMGSRDCLYGASKQPFPAQLK